MKNFFDLPIHYTFSNKEEYNSSYFLSFFQDIFVCSHGNSTFDFNITCHCEGSFSISINVVTNSTHSGRIDIYSLCRRPYLSFTDSNGFNIEELSFEDGDNESLFGWKKCIFIRNDMNQIVDIRNIRFERIHGISYSSFSSTLKPHSSTKTCFSFLMYSFEPFSSSHTFFRFFGNESKFILPVSVHLSDSTVHRIQTSIVFILSLLTFLSSFVFFFYILKFLIFHLFFKLKLKSKLKEYDRALKYYCVHRYKNNFGQIDSVEFHPPQKWKEYENVRTHLASEKSIFNMEKYLSQIYF